MPHRFFVDPDRIVGATVSFSPEQAHQIARVLRLQPGSEVLALDGAGTCYRVELARVAPVAVEGVVRESGPATGEPRTHIRLRQAPLKGEKWEWLLQKGTEVGISRFIPTLCARGIPQYSPQAWEGRSARWRRVIQEAAEQSGRGRIPELGEPVSWEQACAAAAGTGIVLYEGERRTGLRQALDVMGNPEAVDLLVGPEGGLTLEEVAMARDYGLTTAGLGPRILRAETAGPVAAALVLYHFGEM